MHGRTASSSTAPSEATEAAAARSLAHRAGWKRPAGHRPPRMPAAGSPRTAMERYPLAPLQPRPTGRRPPRLSGRRQVLAVAWWAAWWAAARGWVPSAERRPSPTSLQALQANLQARRRPKGQRLPRPQASMRARPARRRRARKAASRRTAPPAHQTARAPHRAPIPLRAPVRGLASSRPNSSSCSQRSRFVRAAAFTPSHAPLHSCASAYPRAEPRAICPSQRRALPFHTPFRRSSRGLRRISRSSGCRKECSARFSAASPPTMRPLHHRLSPRASATSAATSFTA